MCAFKQYAHIQSRWLGDDKTVLLIEVTGPWTWGDAFTVTAEQNAAIRALPHDVYVIIHFHPGSRMIPSGMELRNLRDLLRQDNPNERLVIVAGGHAALEKLMAIASRIYRLTKIFMKYRFVYSLDEALQEIDRDRSDTSKLLG